eukprot:UN12292
MSTFSLSSSSLSNLFVPIDGERKQNFKNEQERQDYLHRFEGELYPKRISRRMFMTSWLFSAAALQAFYWECYALSFAIWLVFLMSLNFWRKPTKGTRRNIDILSSCSVALYHMIYALFAIEFDTAVQYCVLVQGGLVLFAFSKMSSKRNLMDLDSFFHCLMHLYGICVNCWFYPKVYQGSEML